MTWEGVPWFVDGGEHGPEVARTLAYAAMNGHEGVIGVDDCKVTASAIPDGNIHIAPGAIAALNRFGGGDGQGYILRNVGDEAKAMTPQGSSGERWDLVAAIVQDPQYAGQPAPPSVPDGPYVVTAVYEDVPSTTRTLAEVDPDQTGVALALVKFNASDGTVNDSEITDLRQMLLARSKTVTKMISLDGSPVNLGSSLQVFPTGASWTIDVPEWANRVSLSVTMSGVNCLDGGADGGTAQGKVQVELGTITTDQGRWQANAVGPGRQTTMTIQAAEGDLAVPEGIRGTSQTLRVRATHDGGSGMSVRERDGLTAIVNAIFEEVPA